MDAQNVLILGVSRYDFKDDRTGNDVRGTTVWYAPVDTLDEDHKVGLTPVKASLPYQVFDSFVGHEFPSLAKASISLDLSNRRNPIKINGFSELVSVSL